MCAAVKRFPRTSRSNKAKEQQEGRSQSPSQVTTKSTKKCAKQKQNENSKEKHLLSKANRRSSGSNLNEADGENNTPLPNVGVVPLNSGSTIGQDEELALADTDLANVKFKLSPSEAMLYLQATATSVSQLFKYDGPDGSHSKTSAESPVGLETVGTDDIYSREASNSGIGGASLNRDPSVASGGAIMSVTEWPGTNGSGLRHGGRLRGKRGPEEAARMMSEGEGERFVPEAPSKKQLLMSGDVVVSDGIAPTLHAHHLHTRRLPSRGSLSTPPLTPISPSHSSQFSHSPELATLETTTASPFVSEQFNNINRTFSYTPPCVTPNGTPMTTPYQSPLQSPVLNPTYYSHQHSLQPPHFHPTCNSAFLPDHSAASVTSVSSRPLDVCTTLEERSHGPTSSLSALSSLNLLGHSTATEGLFQLQKQQNNTGGELCNVV